MKALREGFEAGRRLVDGARRILVSGHLSPDGDSLGSMIALVRLLRGAGHDAVATADVNALGRLGFLDGVDEIVPIRKLKRQKRFDLFIAVDNSGFDRMPSEVRPVAEKLPKICIDHHVTSDAAFADVSIVDPGASSTGEIVWRIAKWNEWKLDRTIAEALWVAMITDSGRFAYDSTKPGTMRAAGDLLKYGVRTAYINDLVYGTFSRKAIELKRLAWRSLHVWKNRKVAEVSLTRDDFRAVRGSKADAEDIIEIPRSVAKNEIALFFYQIPDRTKETRCSIRTRGEWDATVIAGRFGGGGHRKAAGCTIKATLGAAKRQMRSAVKEILKGACRKTRALALCLVFFAVVAVAADAPQSFEAAVDSDAEWSAGIFRRYPFEEVRDTPSPAGFRPFYVSHYGRHGCRYQADEEKCAAAVALDKAAAEGALTEKGLRLQKALHRILSAHEGMYGQLTKRGAEEHRRIARRMRDRFPRVFSEKGQVRCQSSTYPRCLASMANFTCELKGLSPQLEFDFATGERYMATILNTKMPGSSLGSAQIALAKRLLKARVDTSRIVGEVFADSSSIARFVDDRHEFAFSLFHMVVGCRPLSVELGGLEIYDVFTSDETKAFGRALNGRWYMLMANSAEFGDKVVARSENLARDFAKRAEEAIGGGGVVADLRFGHDSGLWPFLGYLGVEGAGDRVSYLDVCSHPSLWKSMPMAANLQMAFYRNDAGDVLVKVLHNESEVRLRGLVAVSGPYYRWGDVRARLMSPPVVKGE